jgi:hypothetical protein
MIQENPNYNTEDDISPEEQKRIMEEIAKEKGFRDFRQYKNRAAKNRGHVNWDDYVDYLARKGEIPELQPQEGRKFYTPRKKRRKVVVRRNKGRAIGRLIGNSPRGIGTKRSWLLDKLRDPIGFVESLKGLTLTPTDVYEILGMNREEYLTRVQIFL